MEKDRNAEFDVVKFCISVLASAKFWSFYCKTCWWEYSKWLQPTSGFLTAL